MGGIQDRGEPGEIQKAKREREGGRIIQSELSSRIKTADELRSAAELKCLFENTRRLILNSNLTEM